MTAPKKVKVGLYVRVSTDEQTTENQSRELLRFCELRGFEVTATYEDTGVSGTVETRPGLDKLMSDARQNRFDAVVVWKFDRFARSTGHLLQALQEFKALEIDFLSCSEGIDTSTAVGKMVFTFLGAVAEFEHSLIRERVKAGIARAQAENIHCGRPRKGLDVAKALELHRQGLGWRSIGRELGVSFATVRRTVQAVEKCA